jgi:predicted DNA-binding transcriptional regulator AlpA
LSRRPKSEPDPINPGTAAPLVASLASTAGRMAYRLDELATALGVSRRTIERERSAGRFPKPDLHVGKMPLWTPETIRRWVEGGGDR